MPHGGMGLGWADAGFCGSLDLLRWQCGFTMLLHGVLISPVVSRAVLFVVGVCRHVGVQWRSLLAMSGCCRDCACMPRR